jgi:Flp pilus assembly protein CpaB
MAARTIGPNPAPEAATPNGVRGERPMRTSLPRRHRLRGLLSTGHVVMIVAGLVGMLLTLALLRGADDRQPVAVAAHDIAAGDVVTEASFAWEDVRADDDLLANMLEPNDVDQLDGSIATGPIAGGEPISRSDVRDAAAPAGLRAVSIPIDPARAVDGDVSAGDRVDVVLAGDRRVTTVVVGAEVLAVSRPDGGGFGELDDAFTITLAVDAAEAQMLTAAVTDGDILLARSTGAEPADDVPPLSLESTGA